MKWITNDIATGAYSDVNKNLDMREFVFDVRDLVDKSGNNSEYLKKRINDGLEFLNKKKKIIVCCDYGMSRSNSIAVGIIAKFYRIDFFDAVKILKEKVAEDDVKIEMLNSVFSAMYPNKIHSQEKKNVLLTGGGGFLGKAMRNSLSHKHTVYSPSSKEINLLTDVLSLNLFVKEFNIDTIVHLANPKIFTTAKSMGDTIVMLKNILDVCRTNELRLVFLSGWEIYSGYTSYGLLADESLSANPKGTYGETKWLCEELIKQYSKNYTLQCLIIRSGPVYGPYADKPKFLYNFIDKAIKDEDIFTHKYLNGHPTLDLIYITDFCTIVSKCIEQDYSGDINIGSGKSISTNEIAYLIKKMLKSKSNINAVEIEDNAPNIIMNTDFLYRMFNVKSEVSLEMGLKMVIDEYKSRN